MILNYISKFKQNQDSIFGLFNILKVSLLLLPISIILGNAAININTLIIIILFFINFFFNKTLNYNYKNLTLIFIFFLILLIINIFFSEYKYDSTKSTIGIIRYFLLMIAFLCCFENDKKFLNNFSRILFYIILFVAIDTLIQYFFGKDLFGIENTSSHGNRLSGPFGDEYIVGSYISKFIFISSIYLVFKNKKNITLIYILFLVVTVILTKERMASFMIVASSITFIFFSTLLKLKKKILAFIFFLLTIAALLSLNESVRKHFIFHTFDQIGITQNEIVKNETDHYNFWDSQWGAHFLTAYGIFLNNPVMGTGVKSFRYECKKKEYEKVKSAEYKTRCSTHPHNFYLEILSETGILIFFPFVILNLIITFKLISSYFRQSKDKNLTLLAFCSFAVMFFPIQSTGSFFSTWNGLFYWLIYSFTLYVLRNKSN